MRHGRSVHAAALVLLAALAGGCLTADDYAEQADAEVGPLLDQVQAEVLAGREATVELPEAAVEAPPEEQPAGPALEGAEAVGQQTKAVGRATDEELTAPLDSDSPDAIRLDLHSSLERAVNTGRDFQNQRESLYLEGLALTLTRYNFGPLLNGTIAYLWNDTKEGQATSALTASLGMTQILDSGGTLGLGTNVGTVHTGGNAPFDASGFESGLSFDLTQPLLRGAGYLVSHEALTQGERNVVYAVRDFELFREDFTIGITRDFYDLVRRRKNISNLEQSWRDAVFDRNKSEALRQVDRNKDEDVFNARRREIDAENTLLEARTDYKAALDQFKIQLGLTTSTPVVVIDELPIVQPVALDEESAVEVALHNRLDLITAREQVEDVERGLIIARDGLRPDLTLVAGAGLVETDESLDPAFPDEWSATAGLTLDLPLNRQSERNAYRSAQIAVDRARRDLQLQYDDIERDVRDQLRSLKQTEQQIELQKEQITQEERAVAVIQIRYESGDAESRDLLDARQSLVDAQNDLIDLQAQHVVARLTLWRTLGVLFIGPDGMWVE